MAKVRISFLGTGRKDKKEQSKYAYEATYYQFENNEPIATPFFAEAALETVLGRIFFTPSTSMAQIIHGPLGSISGCTGSSARAYDKDKNAANVTAAQRLNNVIKPPLKKSPHLRCKARACIV